MAKQKFEDFTPLAKAKVINDYLIRLGNSLNVNYEPNDTRSCVGSVKAFMAASGWGKPKGGASWEKRVEFWDRSDTRWLNRYGQLVAQDNTGIPVFPSWFEDAVTKNSHADHIVENSRWLLDNYEKDLYQDQDHAQDALGYFSLSEYKPKKAKPKIKDFHNLKKEESKMKKLFNNVLDANKEAVHIGIKLTTGKTANSFLLNKIFGHFPWYARFFGKKKDLTENVVAKLVTANLAKVMAENFAEGNEKLQYLSDAMIQDAMVDLTRDSGLVNKLIAEMESMVQLPDFTKSESK